MPASATPLPVVVISDVVCPWCFIGKRRLEKAAALRPDIPIVTHWRPYFLNPWVPREGMSRADYLTKKFGSVAKYDGIARRVAMAAEADGLVYAVEKMSRQPNTIDCHRLIAWADAIGAAGEMKQRLMDVYFSEGADLSDRQVLVQAAADCGLDAAQVATLLASDHDIDRVTREAKSATDAGIDGVPCFIFGGAFAVSGAQAPEYLADAISRAATELAGSGAGASAIAPI
ncbi:MAG: DsbA family oxidoreductase [Proteobacteria bacterium]|nr:DsbA family oxidoreductase [Pseudomonadota bacterium]